MNLNLMDVMKQGGDWIGAARNWLLWNKDTGGHLTWGSDEEVRMTVKDCEEISLAAAAAERERCAKLMDRLESTYEHNGPTQVSEMFKSAAKQIREGR